MESTAHTVLRYVALLSMLLLSLAAEAPYLRKSVVIIPETSKLVCAEKCAISCALNLINPAKYAACFGLCMTACGIGPNSNVGYGCTHSCVSSMSKVMTTSTVKPSISDLTSYAKGYVDSCNQSCSKNNKLFR